MNPTKRFRGLSKWVHTQDIYNYSYYTHSSGTSIPTYEEISPILQANPTKPVPRPGKCGGSSEETSKTLQKAEIRTPCPEVPELHPQP